MNAVKKLALVLSLGALAAAASAATSEKAYVEAYEGRAGVPVPVKVVAPDIVTSHGSEAIVSFTVNKAGVPTSIAVDSTNDEKLASAAVEAVSKWRFTPVMKDGNTVETKVKVPFRAELPSFGPARYASVF